MRNHPKRYLLEIQRFGSPGFGLKLSVRMGSYGVLTTQLQAKSWRAKPLNFQKIFFGVVPHTILLGIRGCTKFFWSIDPLYTCNMYLCVTFMQVALSFYVSPDTILKCTACNSITLFMEKQNNLSETFDYILADL